MYYSPEWSKPGHCNRCNNGRKHYRRKRKPTGTILQNARPFWDDEIAPGEKADLHRIMRAKERRATRKEVQEETCP